MGYEEYRNIYQRCRIKARDRGGALGKASFGSAEKASKTLQAKLEAEPERPGREDIHVSYGSIKDYESSNGDCGGRNPGVDKKHREPATPNPETVLFMAEAYGTPELKWLHCSRMCPLGREIARTDDEIGNEDVYHTYFDLVGAFNRVGEIENELHRVIEDDKLGDDEGETIDKILAGLDRITEGAKELRVWVEDQRASKEGR